MAEQGRCNDKLAGWCKATYCAQNRLSNRFIYGCESDQLDSEWLVEIIVSHINSLLLTKDRYAVDYIAEAKLDIQQTHTQ